MNSTRQSLNTSVETITLSCESWSPDGKTIYTLESAAASLKSRSGLILKVSTLYSVHALASQVEGVMRHLTQILVHRDRWQKDFNHAFGFRYNDQRFRVTDWEHELSDFWSRSLPERYTRLEDFQVRFALLRINEFFDYGKFDDPKVTYGAARRHPIAHGMYKAHN